MKPDATQSIAFRIDVPESSPGESLIRTYLPKTLQQAANILEDWSEVMMTQIALMLAVSGGNAAIDCYKAAFGSQLLWHLGGGGDVIAPGQP
jgi:hypothetical protein